MTHKNALTLRPDYSSPKCIIGISIGVALIDIAMLIWGIRSSNIEDICISITGIVILTLSCIAWVMDQVENNQLSFEISPLGIDVIISKRQAAVIAWNQVQEIFIIHGPCEPTYAPPLDILWGPYGLYIALEPNCSRNIDQMKADILNLNDTLGKTSSPPKFRVVKVYGDISYRKCNEMLDRINQYRHG